MKHSYSLVLMCLLSVGLLQARIYNTNSTFFNSSSSILYLENNTVLSGLDADSENAIKPPLTKTVKTLIDKTILIAPIIPGSSDNFITTWKVVTGDLTITIPTLGVGYNYNIYWSEIGNPTNQNTITNNTGDQTITFPSAGTYKVEINGDFPQFYINHNSDRDKIQSVEQWGTIVWRSMQSAFYGTSNLTVNATDSPDLSQVTDMSSMFAASSFNSPVNNWDVSNVTNIASLFNAAYAFNQSLSNWNVSNVTDMHALFTYAAAFNQDISSWDVSKVTNMYGMFFGASAFNQNISNWNVSQVINMGLMFNEAISFNQNLGNWNVTSVGFMNAMLDDAALSTANYDKTLAGWATQNLKTNVSLGALGLHYCNSETARQSIIDNYGWSITRDSKDCTNNAPTDISLSNNSINQSVGVNATVGTLSSTDADVGDTHTYSLVTGTGDNDNSNFNIAGALLRANNTSTMCNSTYSIRIRTTDAYNGSYEKTFSITVIDDVAPVPNVTSLPNIEMECAVKTSDIPVPVATDPCTGTVNATTSDPLQYNTTGTYTITWNYTDNNNNSSSQTQTVIVKPSTLGQATFDDTTVTYNGTAQSIAVANLPTGATVSYTITLPTGTVSGNSAIDAGTYPVIATITPPPTEVNCSPIELHATLTILKADLTGVDFEGAHFIYDGMSHSILATDIPPGATVIYTNNSKIQAGTYEVTVLISLPNYNDLELTAILIIDKATAIITADDVQTQVYDGTIKNAVANLNNPEGVLIYTPQQGYIDAGTYPIDISAAETTDYLAVSKTISLVIEKADLTGIVFNGANFTYDGTAHSLAVSNLPTGATVVYTNNNQTQAGTYQVTALISLANYNDLELTATLIINKAIAIITADDVQTQVYDGTVKNAVASLNNAEGVLVYTPQQGYINAGTYPVEISAAETTNYLAVSKTISLVIEKADLTGIVFNGANFAYDGTAHSLAISNLPTGATVVYTNNKQTQAGTYQVTALVSLPNYNDLELTATLIIDKANQFITFDPIPEKNLANGTSFQLNATASSGENVYYTYTYSTPNPAATVTPTGLVQLLTAGSILITAHQDGNQNYNPAETVQQELLITSSDNSIREIIINNRVYENPESELYYLIDCDDNSDVVNVQIKTETSNQVSPGLSFAIQTPRPGIYRQKITVTAPDGTTREYEIIIEKKFDFEDIVVSKFDNVLLVNNNPQTNGGFEFVAYEWYKNGTLISTEQYYSAGDNASDHLGSKSIYTVRVKTKQDIWLTTCEIEIAQKRSYSVKLVPNPVYSGTLLKVISDFPTEELKDLKISIYDLTGRLILEKPSNQNSTEIIVPLGLTPSAYILRFDTGKTIKAVKFLVH